MKDTKDAEDKPLPDPHYGTDEEMTAWAKKEGLEIVKDEEGNPDWAAVYANYTEGLRDE